jgi:hypothetical protein
MVISDWQISARTLPRCNSNWPPMWTNLSSAMLIGINAPCLAGALLQPIVMRPFRHH